MKHRRCPLKDRNPTVAAQTDRMCERDGCMWYVTKKDQCTIYEVITNLYWGRVK